MNPSAITCNLSTAPWNRRVRERRVRERRVRERRHSKGEESQKVIRGIGIFSYL